MESFREGKGIGDRDLHIRNSHLGDDRTVDIFDQRVNDTLWMDEDDELFCRNIEKPVGLDDR